MSSPPAPAPDTAEPDDAVVVDTSRPSAARLYDYWLGGKDHFAADREAAQGIEKESPGAGRAARENRRCLGRMVRFLAGEAGIRQFLDIGTGLPSANNVHEVAQQIAPESRIVYVDNDPSVLAHARALLTSSPEGVTSYISADLRKPRAILAQAARTLDFSQPIALMLVAILHFIADEDGPWAIVDELMDALPAGSYLAVSATTLDNLDEAQLGRLQALYARTPSGGVRPRSREEIARFFGDMELADPGIVDITKWRPVAGQAPEQKPGDAILLGGVARKA